MAPVLKEKLFGKHSKSNKTNKISKLRSEPKERPKRTASKSKSKKFTLNKLKRETSRNTKEIKNEKDSKKKEDKESEIPGYTVHEILGEGTFSTVYRVTKIGTPDKSFACKKYKFNERTQKWIDRGCLTREMEIALIMKHPNIVKAYEAFYQKDLAYLLMELAPNGSMRDYLEKMPPLEFPEENKVRFWFTDMLAAVAYMHGKEIVHRDIKTGNFLFDKTMNILLSDFSFSCRSPNVDSLRFNCMFNTVCGTADYLAPEVHMNFQTKIKYNAKKADAYALGVCLFELFAKKTPFYWRYTSHQGFVDLQLNQDYEMESEAHASCDALKLIDLMLEPNSCRRISVTRALMNDWLRMEPTVNKEGQSSRFNRIANPAWERASLDTNRSISITDSNSEVLFRFDSDFWS